MAYVHYVSKERLQPVDICCEAFLNVDDAKEIEKLVHEVYSSFAQNKAIQLLSCFVLYHFRHFGARIIIL